MINLDLTNGGKTNASLTNLEEAIEVLVTAIQATLQDRIGEILVPHQMTITGIVIPVRDTTTLSTRGKSYTLGMPVIQMGLWVDEEGEVKEVDHG